MTSSAGDSGSKQILGMPNLSDYYGVANIGPNYSGFAVIGAGLPRTATMSLRAALCHLLDGPCYHMICLALGNEVTMEKILFCSIFNPLSASKDDLKWNKKFGLISGRKKIDNIFQVDWNFWTKALEGKMAKRDWVDFLERRGFRAGVDYPIALFYKYVYNISCTHLRLPLHLQNIV